jgi:hypothetical protein
VNGGWLKSGLGLVPTRVHPSRRDADLSLGSAWQGVHSASETRQRSTLLRSCCLLYRRLHTHGLRDTQFVARYHDCSCPPFSSPRWVLWWDGAFFCPKFSRVGSPPVSMASRSTSSDHGALAVGATCVALEPAFRRLTLPSFPNVLRQCL